MDRDQDNSGNSGSSSDQNHPGAPEPVTNPFVADDDPTEPPNISGAATVLPQVKKRPKTGLIVGGIAAVLALGAGGYFLSTTGGGETTEANQAPKPASTATDNGTSTTSTTTSTSESATAELDYVLINDSGQLDCSALSEIPEFTTLNPVPNEYAEDRFVQVRPMGSQSNPYTQCEIGTEEGGLILVNSVPSGCPESGAPFNEEKGWKDWHWDSFAINAPEELEDAIGNIRGTTISYDPNFIEGSIGCISISGTGDSPAVQDILDSLAEIIYENTPQQ